MWRSPSANEPGITPERLEPIEGGELGGMNRHFDKHTGRMAQIGLTQQVALRQWPTPCSRGDDKGGPVGLGGGQRAKEKLKEMVGREQQLQMSCGSLNPDWVCWLMGWPIGWSSLEPLTELVWLSWKIDPADMEEAQESMPTPSAADRKHIVPGGHPDWGGAAARATWRKLNNDRPSTGPIPRVATGIRDRVNRLKALGNGQVSLCAATAFRILAGQ